MTAALPVSVTPRLGESIESWLEHLRQHERMTVTDRDISYRARDFHVGSEPPIVRHLIARMPIG